MWRSTLLPVLLVLLLPAAGVPHQAISALDLLEVRADGFGDLRGIAVDDHGNVFVADREHGTLTRIAPDRSSSVVADGLERPIGIAVDHEHRVLVAEERGGRVVRVERDGARTTLMAGVKRPRWLAVAGDGTVFVSARRLTRDADPEPDDEADEPETILVLRPGRGLAVFADGFKGLQGLALSDTALFAAAQGLRDDRRSDGVVFRIPILPEGGAGTPSRLGPADQFKKPVGLVLDGLGALYFTTRALDSQDDRSRRAVAKLHPTGAVTRYAENLDHPQGLALDAGGNLYVADGASGRVLRFEAPPAPAVTSPDIASRSPFLVTGTTRPVARVDLFVNDAATPATVAADATGAFALPVDLVPNAANAVEVVATSHGGRGLTSRVTDAVIVHDSVAPALGFAAPPAGASVRGDVSVQAHASDAATGVQALLLTADGDPLPAVVAPDPPSASATATATWDTLSMADGPRTLAVTAIDRAGNSGSATRGVIVDNSPPDTRIVEGSTSPISATDASFRFTGTDNLTPVASLVYAWRLDDGAWAAFGSATSVSLANLAPGAHAFEVKARDLAGNEDPTPARQTFTVASGAAQVTITDPADGAVVTAEALIVRGNVTTGGAEVGVTVNGVVAAVHAGTFAALVPVTPGAVTLTAVATTSGGARGDHSVSVTVTGSGPRLLATPLGGLAPLAVSFSLSAGAGATIVLDADGDGIADFTGPTLENRSFTFGQPGLYYPVATVTDSGGRQTTARAVVQVYDRAGLDAFFRAKWEAMKSALVAGDLAGAAGHFAASQQDRYRALFTALAGDIARIARDMQDIELIYVIEGRAKCRLRRTQAWGGQLMTLTYYVYFLQDDDGLWTIESF